MTRKCKIGTRGSELALAQAQMVVDRLKERWSGLDVETKIIKTRGDDSKTAIVDVRGTKRVRHGDNHVEGAIKAMYAFDHSHGLFRFDSSEPHLIRNIDPDVRERAGAASGHCLGDFFGPFCF